MFIWISFIISFFLLIFLARRELWFALFFAGSIFALTNLTFPEYKLSIMETIGDSSIFMLALALGIIPFIGAILNESGILKEMIDNLKMNRRTFMAFAPSFMGLLPVPGGALLSTPMLKYGRGDVNNVDLSVINIWFRHLLILIYPLSSLLVCTKMANVEIYEAVFYLIPGFLIMLIFGYFFYLRKISGELSVNKNRDLKKIIFPTAIILSAPFLHIILLNIIHPKDPEGILLFSVSMTFILLVFLGKINFSIINEAWRNIKPWKFSLLLIMMFYFIHIFQRTQIVKEIANLTYPMYILIIPITFIFSFLTGRIQTAVALILPIFFAKYGQNAMTSQIFAIFYFSMFIGYIISPLHVCLLVTIEYFNVSMKDFYKRIFPVITICFIAVSLTAYLYLK
jgi:integral membrane protein (TIGR00529 family)